MANGKYLVGYVPNPDYTKEDWDEVADNPAWTKEDFAKAKPLSEAMPELAAALRRGRGKQIAPTKVQVTLRLDPRVVAHFKAAGDGWQVRINEALLEAISAASSKGRRRPLSPE